MKLHEYQAKEIFDKYKIPVQKQIVALSPTEAEHAAHAFNGPVAIKAQVLSGGRGKAGGVQIVNTPHEARQATERILRLSIQGFAVNKVLVAPAVSIATEYYIAITVDRSRKKSLLIFCPDGGVDIEQLAAEHPTTLRYIEIDPLKGLTAANIDTVTDTINASGQLQREFRDIIGQLYRLYLECDCALVEINPLAQLNNGSLSALDAKVIIDDNSLYKHPALVTLRNEEEYHPDELIAKEHGLSFVNLEGAIGCIVNGAGLAMATMDLIKHFGGHPANFLDVGGSSNPHKVLNALRILIKNSNIRAILINIFGGITRCDDIAHGLLMATAELDITAPLVIRLVGTNEQEGRALLEQAGHTVFNHLNEAVEKVVSV